MKKIELYIKPSCNSSRKAKAYFERNNIPHEVIEVHKKGFSPELVRTFLSLCVLGTEDLFKNTVLKNLEKMTVDEAIAWAVEDPTIIRTPIVLREDLEGHTIQIGYSEDDFGTFIPRSAKLAMFQRTTSAAAKNAPETEDYVEDLEEYVEEVV